MPDINWIYFAIAKDIMSDRVVPVMFPKGKDPYAHKGDRVACQNADGDTLVADILYTGHESDSNPLVKAMFDHFTPGKSLYVANTLWGRVDLTGEEEDEDD